MKMKTNLGGLSKGHVWRNCRVDDRLAAFHAYNAVQVAGGIVEKTNADSLRTGCYPGAFCLRIDVEYMCVAGENWLFPGKRDSRCFRSRR